MKKQVIPDILDHIVPVWVQGAIREEVEHVTGWRMLLDKPAP
jgi:hypothetical protein